MSLFAICWWTLVRTVVLCLIAWPICRRIERSLHAAPHRVRPWLVVGLIAPGCFPELLVGYAFRDLALASPRWAEVLCGGLLLVRMIPVGTVALLIAPPPDPDSAALFCRRLLVRSPTGTWRQCVEFVRCLWQGPVVRALPALALMSIVAFQEFELAALLQTMSWTDWFVTAERLGTERGEMLWQSLWPLLWQTPVLLGVARWLSLNSQGRLNVRPMQSTELPTGRVVVWTGGICIVVLLVAGCLVPLGMMGSRIVDGLALLARQRSQQLGLGREIAISLAVSICAGLTAWNLSARFPRLATGLLPLGLFGSLLLSLGCVGLFQTSWLRPIYDTPLPWTLVLVLWLLPRAALLRLWLQSVRPDEAIHLAELLGDASHPGPDSRPRRRRSSGLLWRLRDQPQFLAMSLLCFWAYCDLPTAYLLAPTGMASGLVRLYNFMHFGRSAALSAEAIVFFGIPVIVCFLMLLVTRQLRSWSA